MPRFRSRQALICLTAALLPLTLCGGCSRARKPPRIEAVFLIVVDTLRPGHLSCYGAGGSQTPAMDRLAASGVRFAEAHTVASWTLPSMGAMLTSRYPMQLGLVERPAAENARFAWRKKRRQVRYTLPRGVPTLAAMLDRAGFYPAAFVNQPFINSGDGFQQGFAQWCYTAGESALAWHDPTTPMPTLAYPPGTDLGVADSLLVAEFSGWLAANVDRRPFVWLHLLKPHWPYTPHDRYLPQGQPRPTDPERLYAGEVRESDDVVARVLEAIDQSVGLERSLVILTSDHGEEFLEHGMYEHGHSLHREVIHVPLLMAGPGLPVGAVVGAHVRVIDLVPTILTLAGVDASTQAGLEGVNLLPFVQGRGEDLPVYSEGMLYGSTERSLIADGFKLMVDVQEDPPYRLFDESRDALERTDVVPWESERAARMRSRMVEEHARLVDEFAASIAPGQAKEDPETQRILRAMRTLGYVSD